MRQAAVGETVVASAESLSQGQQCLVNILSTFLHDTVSYNGKEETLDIEQILSSIIDFDELKLATGLDCIDIQHRTITDMINNLFKHLNQGNFIEKATLTKMLETLIDYILQHFQFEEEWM